MYLKIGDIIASALEFKDIKQVKITKDLGIQYSTFNNYVCNTREPDFETLIRIFTYLEIDLNAIFQLIPSDKDYTITKDEAHLLKLFRSIPKDAHKNVIAINQNLVTHFKQKQ